MLVGKFQDPAKIECVGLNVFFFYILIVEMKMSVEQ